MTETKKFKGAVVGAPNKIELLEEIVLKDEGLIVQKLRVYSNNTYHDVEKVIDINELYPSINLGPDINITMDH